MRVATWNINSVRLRIGLLKRLIDEHSPDIICLQETKVPDELFPLSQIKLFGYEHIIFRGEKGYNGVAIISRIPLSGIAKLEMAGRQDARHISAVLPCGTELHNFYVPAGGDEPDPVINPKFDHKLRFVDNMSEWFSVNRSANDNIIITGDFNIAPFEHDVWSHKQLLDVVSHTPVEVEKLNRLKDTLGFVDSGRHFVSEKEKLYSWWSYRNSDWQKSNRGRRLDHLWVTPIKKEQLKSYNTITEARNWQQPSDHVPVIVDFHQ